MPAWIKTCGPLPLLCKAVTKGLVSMLKATRPEEAATLVYHV